MKLCRIEGSVHQTVQDPALDAQKLLVAQPLDLELQATSEPPWVAVDSVGAGEGDLVLVMKEGGGARIVLDNPDSPVQCVVIAVVDDLQIGE